MPELGTCVKGIDASAETSRRLACEAAIVGLVEDGKGEPLNIGRKSRAIPPAMRRALRARDRGCRFPGCTRSHYVDGHHIRHWAEGGETSLENLVTLCRYHHRLVHEGGFDCVKSRDGEIVFTDPKGMPLEAGQALPDSDREERPIDWFYEDLADLDVDSMTCVPKWHGETIDWGLAVDHMIAIEARAAERNQAI